jgi:uncharacterized protein (TIGR02246 family)
MPKLGTISLLATSLVVSTTACNRSHADAAQYIEQSERDWAAAVATNDTTLLQRILADDLIWIFDGRTLTKQQAIAEAAQGPGPFLSNRANDITIRFFGDNTAVAQGSETWTKRPGSGPTTGRFVWTDTWIKRNGQWQIVAAEDLVAPAEPPTR